MVEAERLPKLFLISVVFSVVLAIPLAFFAGYSSAFGLVFGGVWSSLNLLIWKILIAEFFGPKRHLLLPLIIIVKIPLLYGLGLFVIQTVSISLFWGIIGFHIPFIVVWWALTYRKPDHAIAKTHSI